MSRELADRRERLFGREDDLAGLVDRARFKGLTAVVARPQMGKSWLLGELARRLVVEQQPPHLVGFAESAGQTPDLLLRTVLDLYSRWLEDATYRQRARMVWQQQSGNLLPGVVKAVATMIAEAGQIAKPIAGVVEDAINGLIATNQTLTTGGLQLPTLQYDQARDLVALTYRISGRRITLVLDQWEQSPDPRFEAKTLHAFLHHLDDWPPCHVFVALRPDEPAYGEVEKLVRSLPGTAQDFPLHEMKLESDEGYRLTAFVRRTVSAALDESDDDLLDLISGFPGVLYHWTSDYQREHMESRSDLEFVANSAQQYRFSQLDQLLRGLEDDQKRMAIRVVLLPSIGVDTWPSIKQEVLGDLAEGLLDDLALASVFETRDPPGFGHAKRWESARNWLVEQRRADARSEIGGLIARLATSVRSLDIQVLQPAVALRSLLPAARELGADDVWQATCQAAASLFGDYSSVDETLIRGAKAARSAALGAMVPLLAMGLVNTLNDAKAEEDLARRDALLAELKALAGAHPEDAAVREGLAQGLVNTLIHAKAEEDLARRDALLAELRALAGAHPEDAAVRERLAVGLFNTLNDAKAEDDLARRDALLAELRALAGAHPEDAAVRDRLAVGLFNTLNAAKAEDDLARRDALLAGLRALAGAHPQDAAVREELAKGLFNTLNAAKAEQDLARRDALLAELRALAGAHPEDAALREPLARGLVKRMLDAADEGEPELQAKLREELRGVERLRSGGLI